MSEERLSVASRDEDVARPQPEVTCAANLLEEIRARIWFNTGCSDDAAENAAAAVYDLFLDQQSVTDDLREALQDVADERTFNLLRYAEEDATDYFLRCFRAVKERAGAAIRKAEGN